MDNLQDMVIAACVLEMARERGPAQMLCATEVAKRLGADDWTALMPRVLSAAAALAGQGKVRVTQSGKDVDPLTAEGPIGISVIDLG